MVRILERYEQQHSNTERELNETNHLSEECWTLGHAKLKDRIDLLQRNQRNLMGEDIDSLNLKELHHLEQQLETALRRLRLKKIKGKEKEPVEPPLVDLQTQHETYQRGEIEERQRQRQPLTVIPYWMLQ
ncbi:hypothetical protein L1987_80245 [Smallanthus sonchifolius]|uniref:Uncharacterized protein n=1 Tax=Smallanthus sonchifolius TaxID=185202 RepID=A0ACB8YMT2_9ASTR|nr:hypothetical protein L1987_80245 [Smallanthus sonchifolius]